MTIFRALPSHGTPSDAGQPAATRPVDPDLSVALRRRWDELPDRVRTAAQLGHVQRPQEVFDGGETAQGLGPDGSLSARGRVIGELYGHKAEAVRRLVAGRARVPEAGSRMPVRRRGSGWAHTRM